MRSCLAIGVLLPVAVVAIEAIGNPGNGKKRQRRCLYVEARVPIERISSVAHGYGIKHACATSEI